MLAVPLAVLGASLVGCSSCEPDASNEDTTEPAPLIDPERDPRLPASFELPLPEDAVVRYSIDGAEGGIVFATVFATGSDAETECSFTAFVEEIETLYRAAGFELDVWMDRREMVGRKSVSLRHPEVRIVAEQGFAGVCRMKVTYRHPPQESTFHAPEEPLEWRRIARLLRPAPGGERGPDCSAAILAGCERWSAAGGGDALECAMDHRAACVWPLDPELSRRTLDDFVEQLVEAAIRNDLVASGQARQETEAQLALLYLAARAGRARLRAQEADASTEILERADLELPAVQIDREIDAWFSVPP